jgi:NADH-quinone oxidoreductase subunit N
MPEQFPHILLQNLAHLSYIWPETMVAVTFLLALIFDFVVPAERRKNTAYICIIGLLAALMLNLHQHQQFLEKLKALEHANGPSIGVNAAMQLGAMHPQSIFSGMLVYDQYGTFFKFIILIGTIISLLLSIHARELFGKNHGEFYLLLVAVCLGGMFLASASNLLMIYLSLESLSIVSYAMAGFLRHDRKSAEAGIKYVIYGAMASGIMIFGMSYLYGLTGTLNVFGNNGIAEQITTVGAGQRVPGGAIIAVLMMVFAGFLYKIAAVPFHYWSPDVYEGAPTTATAFFSVVPKAAGFAVLIRALCAFFPLGGNAIHPWLGVPSVENVVSVLAVVTMTLGNLAALGQTNAKRMLAYSSIAHAGYMLAGLSVLTTTRGPAAVLFYLVVYLVMNLGAFLVLVALENVFGGSDLKTLRGAVLREPVLCVALCAFLFSLTGLPPLGGFTGKYYIMVELAHSRKYWMVMAIGFNSVISLYYYMKLAKAVTIDRSEEPAAPPPPSAVPFSYSLLAICKCAALLLLFIYADRVQLLCEQVLQPLHWIH